MSDENPAAGPATSGVQTVDPFDDGAPPLTRRRTEARLVGRGVVYALTAHAATFVLGIAAGKLLGLPGVDGPYADGTDVYWFGIVVIFWQVMLALIVLVAGFGRIRERDGGLGLGLLLGWLLCLPAVSRAVPAVADWLAATG